ncbi:hypothetical protein P43SY_002307 [Pythium insidiosum]|uniref:Uncharacterized protein n=1 Tax=Pythium insidiosum TaxID=114742 RepID=A0AAD5QAS8_PYTIN|nr:hypothetical protein P43SY_002307 [Pythium insidiosum]
MKSWAAVAGVLALATSASGVLVKFNENLLAASPDRRHGISFSTHDVEPLPHNAFLTMDGYYGPNEGYPCYESTEKNATSHVTVLIAISKCLNETSIKNIQTWVEQIKGKELAYFDKGAKQDLKFETTLVPGDCQEFTEREKKGQKEQIGWEKNPYDGTKPAEFLLSNEVLPGEIERIAAFAKFGRVLEGLPSTTVRDEIPIAVVSFVNNKLSYKEVEQFEKKTKITKTFNFQICDKGKSCEGQYENCVFLDEDVDLFMYNPFTVIRSFECDSVLPDGVPVSYIAQDGSRKCFCACPSKYELVKGNYGKDRCEPIEKQPCVCEWDNHPFGYRIENTDNLRVCKFCNIAEKGVPVPFPVDNYVADGRVNRLDATVGGPHVDLIMTPLFSDVYNELDLQQIFQRAAPGLFAASGYPANWKDFIKSIKANQLPLSELDQSLFRPFLPAINTRGEPVDGHFTWRTFQTQRRKKINDLDFTAYGKYELFIDAVDYTQSAQCTGCVAIVDMFRPEATTECPKSFCDNTTSVCDGADAATAELTPNNQQKADEVMKDVYKFQKQATNDDCSGTDNRCDDEDYRVKKFFDESYVKCDWNGGEKCFEKDSIIKDFINNPDAKKNPLVEVDSYGKVSVNPDDVPVAEGKCTRCCKASTTLREFWTDYSCGCDFDIRRCSAGSDDLKTKCGAKQCLTMFGDTLAHVTACIKEDIVEESEKVLSKLVQEGQTVTEVHRSISCADLDPKKKDCRYDVKVTDLFKVTEEAKILDTELNPSEYVFWRYKVVGQNNGWRLFTPDKPGSMPTERFSQAKTKIILEAWTNCGLARRFFFFVHLHVHSEILVCDYFDEMWYQTSTSRLPITSSICAYEGSDFAEVTFDYRPFAGLQYNRNELRPDVVGVKCTARVGNRQSVTILDDKKTNPEIIERFAVELLKNGRTNEKTTVKMVCTFEYMYHDKTTKSKSCDRTITMKDCTEPEYKDIDGECLQECANNKAPGPYEACGGQIISHDKLKTTFFSGEKKCCDRCSKAKTTCTAILGLKNEKDDIKRCVPEVSEYANYAYGTEGAYDYAVPYTENEKVDDANDEPAANDVVDVDIEDEPAAGGAPAGGAPAGGAPAGGAPAGGAPAGGAPAGGAPADGAPAGGAPAGGAPAGGAPAGGAPAGGAPAGGAAALQLSAMAEQLSSMNMSAASLLFASGMVAVLAVVVVRGRRAAAPKPTVAEDAYYPLLH